MPEILFNEATVMWYGRIFATMGCFFGAVMAGGFLFLHIRRALGFDNE